MTEEAFGAPEERLLAIGIDGGECSVREENVDPVDTAKGGYRGGTDEEDTEDMEGSLVDEVAEEETDTELNPDLETGWSLKRDTLEELEEEEMDDGAVFGTPGTGVLQVVAYKAGEVEVESRLRGGGGAEKRHSKEEPESGGAEDESEETTDGEDLSGGKVIPSLEVVKEAMLRRFLSSCWIRLLTW